ncbi:MAG: hypothetical protein ABIR80_11840 [Opitutaceae bacterium]
MPAIAIARRRARNPQIVERTQLVPIVAARVVLDEASRHLGVELPRRYAAGLAYRAHITYAYSPSYRRALHRPGELGRDRLYVFLRHWLADRLHRERPALFARLPADYAKGAPLPEPSPVSYPNQFVAGPLSPDARLLSEL